MIWNTVKTILIDGQLIGIFIGFLFYKLSKNDSNKTQEIIWKKEFDKCQIDNIVNIFNSILFELKNTEESKIPKPINKTLLVRLKTQIELNLSFDEMLKDEIESIVYKECVFYNAIKVVQDSIVQTETEPNIVEKDKREYIERNIVKILGKIKLIFSKF